MVHVLIETDLCFSLVRQFCCNFIFSNGTTLAPEFIRQTEKVFIYTEVLRAACRKLQPRAKFGRPLLICISGGSLMKATWGTFVNHGCFSAPHGGSLCFPATGESVSRNLLLTEHRGTVGVTATVGASFGRCILSVCLLKFAVSMKSGSSSPVPQPYFNTGLFYHLLALHKLH